MKKICLHLFCCFFLCGFAFAQTNDPLGERTNAAFLSGSIDLKSSNESSLLVEDINKGLFIKVLIDGRDYTFLVDTGCTLSIIDENINVKMQPLEIRRTVTDNVGLQKEAELYKLDFSVGNNIFKDFAFMKMDLSEVSKAACVKMHGIIGINVLKKLNWKLLKNENKVYFSNLPYSYAEFGEAVPLGQIITFQ